MKSLESMLNKLSPINVYNLDVGTVNYAEFAAFATGLEHLREALNEVLRESFVNTAQTYGLETLEQIAGSANADLPLEKRREMLIERLSLSGSDFTPAGFEKMLRILGVEGEIKEYPTELRMVLDLANEDLTSAQRDWIVYQAQSLMPAHLDFDVVFAGFDWQASDSLGNTFAQIDTKGYRWKAIDYSIQEEI